MVNSYVLCRKRRHFLWNSWCENPFVMRIKSNSSEKQIYFSVNRGIQWGRTAYTPTPGFYLIFAQHLVFWISNPCADTYCLTTKQSVLVLFLAKRNWLKNFLSIDFCVNRGSGDRWPDSPLFCRKAKYNNLLFKTISRLIGK